MQDIIRTFPGITDAAECNSGKEAFGFFITPTMVDLIALKKLILRLDAGSNAVMIVEH